jgi:uracil-DNA glycosylase family 4
MPRSRKQALDALNAETDACRRCPRLVEWRERVSREKRTAYANEDYWGKPVPGFGAPDARILIVGLAPGAHGSNRTGRPFTGDRSGEWLYRSLHRAGLASQPESVGRDDGMRLRDAYITAVVRCAPPANKPKTDEWLNCRPYLEQEIEILTELSTIVCLGGYAYQRVLRVLRDSGHPVPSPMPRFGHGVELGAGRYSVLASYHPSQQNTFTGKLTEPMLDAIWERAKALSEPN